MIDVQTLVEFFFRQKYVELNEFQESEFHSIRFTNSGYSSKMRHGCCTDCHVFLKF